MIIEITPDVIVNLVSVITTVLFVIMMGFSIFFFRKKERKTATCLLKSAVILFGINFFDKVFCNFLETVMSDGLLRILVLAIVVIAVLGILLSFLRKYSNEE